MNDESIAQLCNEMEKLAPLVPPGNNFTPKWIEEEYLSVTESRNKGRLTYKNEYRIAKILERSLGLTILVNKDKMREFVKSRRIIRAMIKSAADQFAEEAELRAINAELDKLADEEES